MVWTGSGVRWSFLAQAHGWTGLTCCIWRGNSRDPPGWFIRQDAAIEKQARTWTTALWRATVITNITCSALCWLDNQAPKVVMPKFDTELRENFNYLFKISLCLMVFHTVENLQCIQNMKINRIRPTVLNTSLILTLWKKWKSTLKSCMLNYDGNDCVTGLVMDRMRNDKRLFE